MVVIGDLHADLGAAQTAFQLAGAIDDKGEWIGGDLTIVQLGDLIGRSYEDREVLDFIFDIRELANTSGGNVYVVLGNHEVFGAQLRIDYVDEEAWQAFESIPNLNLADPRLADIPEYKRARSAALISGGPYSRRLADFPAVLKIGEYVFAHGGVTPYWAEYGIERINEEVRRWLLGETGQPAPARGVDDGNLDDNVMMSRHFSDDDSESNCDLLDESLSLLGAGKMFVAHTPQTPQYEISSACDGKVWRVDVGMSRAYPGSPQVLEIRNDSLFTVLR
jgi:Calcineurin-like phosphoesterase